MKTNDNEDDTMKNKGGKYSIFVRVTFVIFISSLVTSFIAAQKVEKVVDIDSDKFYEQIANYKENGGQTADDLLYKNNTKNYNHHHYKLS